MHGFKDYGKTWCGFNLRCQTLGICQLQQSTLMRGFRKQVECRSGMLWLGRPCKQPLFNGTIWQNIINGNCICRTFCERLASHFRTSLSKQSRRIMPAASVKLASLRTRRSRCIITNNMVAMQQNVCTWKGPYASAASKIFTLLNVFDNIYSGSPTNACIISNMYWSPLCTPMCL